MLQNDIDGGKTDEVGMFCYVVLNKGLESYQYFIMQQ